MLVPSSSIQTQSYPSTLLPRTAVNHSLRVQEALWKETTWATRCHPDAATKDGLAAQRIPEHLLRLPPTDWRQHLPTHSACRCLPPFHLLFGLQQLLLATPVRLHRQTYEQQTRLEDEYQTALTRVASRLQHFVVRWSRYLSRLCWAAASASGTIWASDRPETVVAVVHAPLSAAADMQAAHANQGAQSLFELSREPRPAPLVFLRTAQVMTQAEASYHGHVCQEQDTKEWERRRRGGAQ